MEDVVMSMDNLRLESDIENMTFPKEVEHLHSMLSEYEWMATLDNGIKISIYPDPPYDLCERIVHELGYDCKVIDCHCFSIHGDNMIQLYTDLVLYDRHRYVEMIYE